MILKTFDSKISRIWFFFGLVMGLQIGCTSIRSGPQESRTSALPAYLQAAVGEMPHLDPEGLSEAEKAEEAPGSDAEGTSISNNSVPSGSFFDWPVNQARYTRGFKSEGRRPHWGIDLAAPRGTPILSAHPGTVIYTGREFKGYGRLVIVEAQNGFASLYAHLDKIQVSEGSKVNQGDVLGSMGRSGRATGVHLHFEIRKDRDPLDPITYLPGGPQLVGKLPSPAQTLIDIVTITLTKPGLGLQL
jgi:murein DD-endopeptidase MepM/ murein hydrolase activator NlpD